MATIQDKLHLLLDKLKETDHNLSVCVVLLQQYLRNDAVAARDAAVILVIIVASPSKATFSGGKKGNKGIFKYATSLYSSIVPKVTDIFAKGSSFDFFKKKKHPKDEYEFYSPKDEHYHTKKYHHHHKGSGHYPKDFFFDDHEVYGGHNFYNYPVYGSHFNEYLPHDHLDDFGHHGFGHQGFGHQGFGHQGFENHGVDNLGLGHHGFDNHGFDQHSLGLQSHHDFNELH